MKIGTQVVLKYSYRMKKNTGTLGVVKSIETDGIKVKWLDTKKIQKISPTRVVKATGADLEKYLKILKNK